MRDRRRQEISRDDARRRIERMARFENTVYHLVMFLLRATQPEYFRRILIDGRPCDETNRHLMVVANHPYGIQDAFLLAFAYERPFYFVATAMNFQTRQGDRIKKRRLRGWLLRQCHVLPIVRTRSEGHMSDNLATFDAAARHIADGDALGIFAEGDSRGNQWNLLKLKVGAAEIALRVAETLRQRNQSVSVQVVGLTYTNWAEPFKSTVTLKFAEPFSVLPVDPTDRAAVRASRREITGRMTESMRQLTVQIPAEYSELSGKIARLYAPDFPNDYERLKGVAEQVARLADRVGERREEVERLLDEYFALADQLKIYPGEERRRRNAALLLLAAIPAYIGFVIHWPILWGTRRLVPSDTTLLHALGSKRVTCAIGLMIGFYVTLGTTAMVAGVWRLGPWGVPLALAVVAAVGACGLVASRSLRHVNLLIFRSLPMGSRFRRYIALGRQLYERLEEYRRQDPLTPDSEPRGVVRTDPLDPTAAS